MTLIEQIEIVCLMEATSRKPGNVHPAASFSDLSYDDFVLAAKAIAAPLALAPKVGLGQAILDAVRASYSATDTNANLGIVLLLAPMAMVPLEVPLADGVGPVLARTQIDDAEKVYEAIRFVQPGGIGKVESQAVSQHPTVTLRDAMALAAERDRIAEQYVCEFQLVFEARQKLLEIWAHAVDWETAIVTLYIWMLSQWTDTLIARKCGLTIAQEASARAGAILEGAGGGGAIDSQQLADFDRWLRADGHRRNPGTTADLIAATLFAAARDGLINLPTREEIQKYAATIGNQNP